MDRFGRVAGPLRRSVAAATHEVLVREIYLLECPENFEVRFAVAVANDAARGSTRRGVEGRAPGANRGSSQREARGGPQNGFI